MSIFVVGKMLMFGQARDFFARLEGGGGMKQY